MKAIDSDDIATAIGHRPGRMLTINREVADAIECIWTSFNATEGWLRVVAQSRDHGGDGCSVALESGSIGSEVKSSVEIVEMCIINQTRCLSSLRLSPYHSALVQGMAVGGSSEDHLFGLLWELLLQCKRLVDGDCGSDPVLCLHCFWVRWGGTLFWMDCLVLLLLYCHLPLKGSGNYTAVYCA